MTTTPTPTGKIRGSLHDVTPKLRNFTGAVKVSTPKGKGGLLVDSGKLIASYLTQEGVLHRAQASLELLGKEPFAEFEILRYDDEQFKEARIICDNRGLLLGGEKGAAEGAPAKPGGTAGSAPGAAEQKRSKEASLLSSMMKRFAAPKPTEKQPVEKQPPAKQEPARDLQKKEAAKAPLQAVTPAAPPAPAEGIPAAARTPPPAEKGLPLTEKKEPPAVPPGETDLSAIIKRLREAPRPERPVPAPAPEKKGEEVPVKASAPVPEPAEAPGARAEKPRAPGEEKPEAASATLTAGVLAGATSSGETNGRVKVDLGQMMKRIKRLDITSIRKELEEGAGPGEGAAKGTTEALEKPSVPGGAVPAQADAPASSPDTGGTSDIDELKAFIRKLEVLEEPKEEPPSEKGFLSRLGVRAPSEETPPPVAKKEVPAPVPRKERPPVEPAAGEIPARDLEKPGVKPLQKEPPAPPEPDRKAKITSLLRRSGLVRPPAGEHPKEIIAPPSAGPKAPLPKEELPAQAEEPGIAAPKPQRKKVEITRVPKKPEKPVREPPLIDEKMIQKLLKQPGVIAVSTFFEGFAVQSAGRADFEQVAANAEDLFRAGTKIAREIDIGPLNQIILETGKGKLIIAPHGDLNVCIFTEPDANLGLIRVAIRGMQVEKD